MRIVLIAENLIFLGPLEVRVYVNIPYYFNPWVSYISGDNEG